MKFRIVIANVIIWIMCALTSGINSRASEYKVLLFSFDVVPKRLAEVLNITQSLSKISGRIDGGYFNENFLLQAKKSPEKKAMTRLGIYASLFTGKWPDKHGVFGVDSDVYNFDDHPAVFSLLSENSSEFEHLFFSSDRLLKKITDKIFPQSIYKKNNVEVFARAKDAIMGGTANLFWVHWRHLESEDSRTPYLLSDYSRQLIKKVVERSSFLDESWIFIYLGLPVLESSSGQEIPNKGFIIVDNIGQSETPTIHSAIELAPSIVSYLKQNSEKSKEVPLGNNTVLDQALTKVKQPNISNDPSEKIEALSNQIKKLSTYLRYLPDTIKKESKREELEQRKAQDKMNQIIFNNLSNRINNVNLVSANHHKNLEDLIDESIKSALSVIILLMVICLGAFLAIIVIQTRNSNQLAQIIRSFAAYKSQQIHSKQFNEAAFTGQKFTSEKKNKE